MTTQNIRKGMRSFLGALALGAATLGTAKADDIKPAADSVTRTVPSAQIVSRSSLIEGAWHNTRFQNLYTTDWGNKFNNGYVLNTDTGITAKGISADVYANEVLETGKVNDLEFTVSGTPIKTKDFSVTTNAGYWIFPDTGFSNAQNVKIVASPTRKFLGLDTSASAQKLWSKESRGVVYELDASRSFPIGKATATLGVSSVYNSGFYSGEHGYASTNPHASINLPVANGLDLLVSYTNENPTSDFKAHGAGHRDVFKISLNADLFKLGKK